MYLVIEICLRYETNNLFLTFNHAKESFSPKNLVRLTRSQVKGFQKQDLLRLRNHTFQNQQFQKYFSYEAHFLKKIRKI